MALLITMLSIPALTQQGPLCGKRADILRQLGRNALEAVSARAMTATGELLEVLTSPLAETWTIIITDPKGKTCLVMVGEAWQQLVEPAFGEGL